MTCSIGVSSEVGFERGVPLFLLTADDDGDAFEAFDVVADGSAVGDVGAGGAERLVVRVIVLTDQCIYLCLLLVL